MSVHTSVICDRKGRRLWILGPICPHGLERINKFLDKMEKESKDLPIKIIISSTGGNFLSSFEIYQKICRLACPHQTIGVKTVDSGAFLIFQAGGERLAAPNASFGFHKTVSPPHLVSPKPEWNADRYYETARTLDRTDAIQKTIFTLRGRPIDIVMNLFNANMVIGARWAKRLKLVDKILSREEMRGLIKRNTKRNKNIKRNKRA